MSGATVHEGPRKGLVFESRAHDYLYDSAYIVSGARDYARTVFKAAMGSAQPIIQPVYKTMFSELRKYPRMRVVLHQNCRLPSHLDRSYNAYLARVEHATVSPMPSLTGKDRFKFCTLPKKITTAMQTVSPEFHPTSPVPIATDSGKPKNKGTQSLYRESSAQTIPWQPDAKPLNDQKGTPEVLYLDKLEWGPGDPYRTGDLPADFHTTEIINKMRHARIWTEVVEAGVFPRWMKNRNNIIQDIETKDWVFREAEIDELQDIRLTLLHKLQLEQRLNKCNKTSLKLAKRWAERKKEMETKIDLIRRTRDRELRKLTALHGGGGHQGQVQRLRSSRGMGSITKAVFDPTSDTYAPIVRHGIQARLKQTEITYDPSLLLLEDHKAINAVPKWLLECGQDLKKTCSGHPLPRDPMVLCERETKWSEKFLEVLHEDLRKARLGAAMISAGPLHVLKPRRLLETPRPVTPEVDAITEADEECHQSALILQKIIRGRAVQCLMYEGRTRAAELTEELKTTHGLQKEDKVRIAMEEAKARDYNALRNETEQKDDAVTALVDELCGGAVSAALDFLEKELRRLKEERRQHAFILVALREKQMREAAEAGRRQKEEQRRREHDEMFKQVLGVTQETVEAYLQSIIEEGVTMGAEEEGQERAKLQADKIDKINKEHEGMSTAETNELVAELVQQFLLPDAHKAASRNQIQKVQQAKLEAARRTIFGLLDQAEIQPPATCIRCGTPLDELCRCTRCQIVMPPKETTSRDDPRWIYSRRRIRPPEKTMAERYPSYHEFRCMLNDLLDDVFDVATGAIILPVKKSDYRYVMRHIRQDAIERTEEPYKVPCSKILPSEIRRRVEKEEAEKDPYCKCVTPPMVDKEEYGENEESEESFDLNNPEHRKILLPSKLRALEELRKCKCDTSRESMSHDSWFGSLGTSQTTDSYLDEHVVDEDGIKN
ncbi:cilia- and flagella-associated protein 91-like isoform X2 [Hyposmocoma kahamanoa]|uniref:cilia- and flagella-associated protein 91-like isoform X2 n=1 Tax=Hyposmocoma kahamanoa TaxID=1477025 RepID=UPI000E6D6625|nr:cilia- and flagella-associated protein 91-like isoform X2 [Hyposmocoma kahamanoa]